MIPLRLQVCSRGTSGVGMGRSITLGEIEKLLRRQLDDNFTTISANEYDDTSRSIVEMLNALNNQRSELTQRHTTDLDESEKRLRRIIESTPVGICITNEDGIYEYVNPTYCRLYGYDERELIGNSFLIVVPAEHREELARLHAEFMGRRYELRGEWSVVKKGGLPMSILADAAYIIDTDHRPKKVTFVLDITERKRAEELLEQTVEQLNLEIQRREILEQTKNEVERMIRHDLRNPLNGIMAAAEILMADDLSDEQRDLCVMIRESGGKLNSMLSASMDLVRMERGSYVLKAEPVDLCAVLKTVRQEMRPLAGSEGVTVAFILDGEPMDWDSKLPLEGETLYVADLFANVIRNAVEGSKRGDTVTVKLTSGETYEISIHNTGVVPDEIRDIFFERYATAGKKSGTGLGTYVAALITKVHNGTIAFETDEQKGTTVRISLPQTQPRPTS